MANQLGISTLRTSAIYANVFKSGCEWLLHLFDTVAGSLCNVFAIHLLIIPLSTNTVLTRFKSAILQLFVVFSVKLLLLTGNKEYICIKLLKRVLFSKHKAFLCAKWTVSCSLLTRECLHLYTRWGGLYPPYQHTSKLYLP